MGLEIVPGEVDQAIELAKAIRQETVDASDPVYQNWADAAIMLAAEVLTLREQNDQLQRRLLR